MNKTEKAWEDNIKERMARGEVLWYKFEGYKFKLADNTYYTPDFGVMLADRELVFEEVKGGFIMDDAKAKWKIAADLYPHRFRLCVAQPKKHGGGWKITEYGSKKDTDDSNTVDTAELGRSSSRKNKVRKNTVKDKDKDE